MVTDAMLAAFHKVCHAEVLHPELFLRWRRRYAKSQSAVPHFFKTPTVVSKFNKTAYQRDYMKKRRAEQKAAREAK